MEVTGGNGGDPPGQMEPQGQSVDVVTCVFKEQRGPSVLTREDRGTWKLWEGQWELSCLLSKVDIVAGVGTVVAQWRSEPMWGEESGVAAIMGDWLHGGGYFMCVRVHMHVCSYTHSFPSSVC